MSRLSKYQAENIVGDKLPKGVKASARLFVTLEVTCSACGDTHSHETEIAGHFNAPFEIQNNMKFTTVKLDRDRRSYGNVEYLLCDKCNRLAHDWMSGKSPALSTQTEQTGE